MEHKIIGGIGIALCFVGMALTGLFIMRRLVDAVPDSKFRLLPLIWAALLIPLMVGQYYLDHFMQDGKMSVRQLLWSDLPVAVMFAVTWLSSYWLRQRKAKR